MFYYVYYTFEAVKTASLMIILTNEYDNNDDYLKFIKKALFSKTVAPSPTTLLQAYSNEQN